jgi:hypothetical protein
MGNTAKVTGNKVLQSNYWSVIRWVTKNLLSRAPPCFGRHVKPLVPRFGLWPVVPMESIRKACAPALGTLIGWWWWSQFRCVYFNIPWSDKIQVSGSCKYQPWILEADHRCQALWYARSCWHSEVVILDPEKKHISYWILWWSKCWIVIVCSSKSYIMLSYW